MMDQTVHRQRPSKPASPRTFSPRTTLLISTLLLTTTFALVANATGADSLRARSAGTISINDKARMTLTGGSGNTLQEEGNAAGTLPGKARVSLAILNTTTAKSTFTVHPKGGSIPGSGTVQLHPGKSGAYESFRGTLSVKHGTGRYARASGSGTIYGVLNRSNDNAEVQVIGTLHY